MNSLVVLLFVTAFTAAKPSAVVVHQSRVDIKSSPAIIATEVVAPVSRVVVAEQSVVAAPPVSAAPTVYSAPVIAPVTVSLQSRIDIKSSSAVVDSVAAVLVAYSRSIAAQVAYGALNSAPVAYGASYATGSAAPVANGTTIAGSVAYGESVAAPLAYSASFGGFSSINSLAVSVVSAITKPGVAKLRESAAARAAHLKAKALEQSSRKTEKRSVAFLSVVPQVHFHV